MSRGIATSYSSQLLLLNIVSCQRIQSMKQHLLRNHVPKEPETSKPAKFNILCIITNSKTPQSHSDLR